MTNIIVKSLSFSTVKQFCEFCPEAIFKEKIDRLPREGISANALLGSCFHTVSEAWFRGLMLNHVFTPEILMRVFTARWNKAPQDEIVYSKKDKDALFQQAEQLIALLIEAERPHQILAIEKPVYYRLSEDLIVLGKPDLVYRDKDGKLVILDVKTSGKSYSDDDLYDVACQTYTYSLAYSEPVKMQLMLFLKLKQTRLQVIDLPVGMIDFEEWRNRFLQVKRALESEIRYKVRGWHCKGCGYYRLCKQASKTEPVISRIAA